MLLQTISTSNRDFFKNAHMWELECRRMYAVLKTGWLYF